MILSIKNSLMPILSSWLSCIVAVILLLPKVDAQHGTVGRPCEVSTDCGTGNYCAGNKRCACLTTYVEIDSYCWRKINPGESGCTQNRQCEAVWPGAYCRSGECRCANNQPPFRTRDGLVCLNYGFCPLNGNNPKFRIENQVQQCYGGADATCEAIGALAYDCICDSDDCTVNNPISFCCPSRAFACIQPPSEGYTPPGGGATLNHWYHDPITGECRELKYQGYGGNANNFQTKDHCESYCKQTCNRGLPLYRDRTTGVKQEPVYCQGSDGGCNNPNYVCTTMGTLQQCCPTYLHICSKNGAIPTEVYNTAGGVPAEYFDVGISDGTGNTYPRFYYDSREGRCIQFSYLGQGGNFNNFLSQDHCEKFCSRILCSAGEPLKDSSGERNMDCSPTGSGANTCPSTHSCESTAGSTTFGGVCCPRPQYVCKLPREQGNCGTYSNRWWFNAKTGNCEEFIYSGCQGNANNFESYKECQDYCRDARSEPQCVQGTALTDSNSNFIICGGTTSVTTTCPANHYCYYDGNTYGCCPTQAYTCSLTYKSGAMCGPAVTRWYYDSTTRTCQTFSFNGCDGNSNNFATQQDCKDYCRVESCPDGGEVWKEPNGAARACAANRQCPTTHYCTPVTTWTGSVYQTKSLCCPSKNYVCSQPRDVGVRCSSTRITRHYFNADTKTCQVFQYNGCEGNRNNFASQKACQNYCLSEACPPGTVVAKESDTSHLMQCSNPGGTGRVSGGCPDGYTCFSSPLLDQNVCCGASTELQSLCPASSMPFISALSLQPMQCTPNVDGACPGNFFCWFSTTTSAVNAFYCCRSPESIDTGYCPPQLVPVSGEGGAQYRYCSPSAPVSDTIQACGMNRHCQFSTTLDRYICCGLESDVKLPNVCPPQPANLAPVELAGNYRTCNPYARSGTPQSCPDNSACLYTGTENGFICCKIELYSSGESTAQSVHVSRNRGSECDGHPGFAAVIKLGGPLLCPGPTAASHCSVAGPTTKCLCNLPATLRRHYIRYYCPTAMFLHGYTVQQPQAYYVGNEVHVEFIRESETLGMTKME